MAVLRKDLAETLTDDAPVDRARLDAVDEEDIRRFMLEDGEDPDAELDAYRPVYPPQIVRRQLSMTDEEFARALDIPLALVSDWEGGRVAPGPAARALMRIVARNPKAALDALTA